METRSTRKVNPVLVTTIRKPLQEESPSSHHGARLKRQVPRFFGDPNDLYDGNRTLNERR